MSEEKSKILVVDDSEINIAILEDILKHDYEVHTGKDGVEAIEKAKAILPDVILLDVILPKMDGFEIIKVLKDDPETSEIPVIFITSLSDVEDERRGLLLGADDYIQKPFDPVTVKLRVDIQMRIVSHLRTISLLSDEIASWMVN
ncbi:MAG: response regulator [Oscillospiraceae bacterium]|nr:response regulator [Oscillospiraceae bacterium]